MVAAALLVALFPFSMKCQTRTHFFVDFLSPPLCFFTHPFYGLRSAALFFAVPRSLLLVVSRRELFFFFFLRVIAIVVVERLTSHPVTSAHPQLTASSFSFSSIDGSDVSQTDSCSCSVGRNGRLEHRRFFDNGHSALVRYEE